PPAAPRPGAPATVTAVAATRLLAPAPNRNPLTVPPPLGLDTNPGNNTATDTDNATADLSVTVTDGAAVVVPGTVDTYTITVSNNGPDTVSNVTLIDAIPATLLNATFGIPSQGSYNAATGAWSGLNLASGQAAFITLSGLIGPNATGTISNAVTVFAPTGVAETNPANNAAPATDTLTSSSRLNPSPPPGPSANMSLRHTGSGLYEIYNLGNNAVLGASFLGQVGTISRLSRSAVFPAATPATCCCATARPA